MDVAMADRRSGAVFGRYLLGRAPSERAVDLFARAVAMLPPLDARDARLAALVCTYRILTGPLDGALALLRPGSGVRRRSYIMLAVLAPTDRLIAWLRRRPLVFAASLPRGCFSPIRTSD
jgi:hypothetical protein